MLKLISAALLAGAMVVSTLPAQAGGYHHRGWGHSSYHHGFKDHHYKPYRHYKRHGHYKRRGYHRRGYDIGDEILLGAGIIGGAIVLNGLVTAPPPAPRYYAPPPPRHCEQDQVYRYLPNGSVQWGTRTRCY